jgi:hypothetical protein
VQVLRRHIVDNDLSAVATETGSVHRIWTKTFDVRVKLLRPAGRMRPASRLTTLCGPRNKLQLLWHFILIAAVQYFTENSDIYKISQGKRARARDGKGTEGRKEGPTEGGKGKN